MNFKKLYTQKLENIYIDVIKIKCFLQDLCTLGIVFSQMTNGILITVHYLVFQRRMDSAMLHMDSITERVLSSPLGHRDIFVETFSRDRNLITLFTKTSIFFNCIASVLYCLPMPLMDLLGGRYRERIPIPIIFFGLRGDRLPIIYEIVIVLEVSGLKQMFQVLSATERLC